jgi:hypothetical protein
MYRRERPIVREFQNEEFLYLRYRRDHWVEGQLDPAGLRFPKTSVYRSLFSEPADALFSEDGRYNGLGVVRFRVLDIPARVEQENGPAYVFHMEHVPLSDHYSHSEIWSRREDAVDHQDREPNKTVKLRFRIRLCQGIRQEQVCIEAVL